MKKNTSSAKWWFSAAQVHLMRSDDWLLSGSFLSYFSAVGDLQANFCESKSVFCTIFFFFWFSLVFFILLGVQLKTSIFCVRKIHSVHKIGYIHCFRWPRQCPFSCNLSSNLSTFETNSCVWTNEKSKTNAKTIERRNKIFIQICFWISGVVVVVLVVVSFSVCWFRRNENK